MSGNNNGDNISTPDRHKRIRNEAEEAYIKTIAKREKLYDDAQHLRQFQIGELVGLRIDKVNRTNTKPKILPCKVISIQSSSDNINTYCFCTTKCILTSKHYANDLIDLRKCSFSELYTIDSQTSSTQTFIQAVKIMLTVDLIQWWKLVFIMVVVLQKNVHTKWLKYYMVQIVILLKRNLVQIYRYNLVAELNDLLCCSTS